MNRSLSLNLCEPFSVPTEQKTTVLPTQCQRKPWEAVSSLKLESCSVMGAMQEGPGPPLPISPSLHFFLLLIISSIG